MDKIISSNYYPDFIISKAFLAASFSFLSKSELNLGLKYFWQSLADIVDTRYRRAVKAMVHHYGFNISYVPDRRWASRLHWNEKHMDHKLTCRQLRRHLFLNRNSISMMCYIHALQILACSSHDRHFKRYSEVVALPWPHCKLVWYRLYVKQMCFRHIRCKGRTKHGSPTMSHLFQKDHLASTHIGEQIKH